MTDQNSVTLIGRLTADAGIHTFESGSSVFDFSIAVNTSKKTSDGKYEDVPNFINIKYYVKNSGKLSEMLKKGSQVCIGGHLTQEHWEKDGQKNSRIVVVAEHIQFCGSKKSTDPSNSVSQTDSVYNEGFHEDLPF